MSSRSLGASLPALSIAFAAGLVFGLGLIVSRMADPGKVLAFLDLAGPWDPSLALVMVGAIAVGSVGFFVAARRRESLLGLPMQIPGAGRVDRPLVTGGLLFGIGWGLAGFCPGPALVALGSGYGEALVFVISMLVGMAAFDARPARRPAEA
jgi:uncharacterized membrane protein YedE/YeeE